MTYLLFLTGASSDTYLLRQTFKKRAMKIADHANNPTGALGGGVEFLRGLDEMERQRMSLVMSVESPFIPGTDVGLSLPSCP